MNMSREIHYIANTDSIKNVLSGYFEKRGWKWLEYPILEMPEVDFLLILEPFRIGTDLCTISTAWKPWLMEFQPRTRLIVAAFSRSRHSNCLNLLDLPDNIDSWLEKVRPVSDFPLIDSGDLDENQKPLYVDPFSFDLASSGKSLNKQMRKFVTGHEASKNFVSQVTGIRKQFKDLELYEKKNGLQKVAEIKNNLSNLWEYFHHRWNYYSTVFDYLPYQKAICKIRKNVAFLKITIPQGRYSQEVEEALDVIINTTRNEMEPYIFPEKHW